MTGDSVRGGDVLPPLSLELSPQRLAMEAAVNRDFTPIHHDPGMAQRTGARTAYANTMLLQALIEAMLRNWAGPRAAIRSLEIAMRSFCYAGSIATAKGRVTEVDQEADAVSTVVAVSIESDDTTCVVGEAVVILPVS